MKFYKYKNIRELLTKSTDNKSSVYNGVKELLNSEWITRIDLKDLNGKFKGIKYIINDKSLKE